MIFSLKGKKKNFKTHPGQPGSEPQVCGWSCFVDTKNIQKSCLQHQKQLKSEWNLNDQDNRGVNYRMFIVSNQYQMSV